MTIGVPEPFNGGRNSAIGRESSIMKNTVVVVGSYNTDLSIKAERIPLPGETVIGGIFSEGGGGKGANQAVAAARAGASVSFIAKVGQDALGDKAVRQLKDEGINTAAMFQDPNIPTGVAFIMIDARGENSIVVASGANARLTPKDIGSVHQEFSRTSVLLVQLESPLDTVMASVVTARQNGLTVILNPAPAQVLTRELLQYVDIITPNKVEAEMITGIAVTNIESMEAITRKFNEMGVKHVLITLGSKGVYAGTPTMMELVPAIKAPTVDSTGAGDVFSGALAAFISGQMPIEQAVRMANAAASISVTRMGAQTSAPKREEIEKFMTMHASSVAESY